MRSGCVVVGLMAVFASACGVSTPAEEGIVATGGYVLVSADVDQVALYATLRNETTEPDSLVSISVDIAGRSSLHEMMTVDGLTEMREVAGVSLPPGESVRLEPGALHGMLEDLTVLPEVGTHLPVTFVFAESPPVVLEAEVRSFLGP